LLTVVAWAAEAGVSEEDARSLIAAGVLPVIRLTARIPDPVRVAATEAAALGTKLVPLSEVAGEAGVAVADVERELRTAGERLVTWRGVLCGVRSVCQTWVKTVAERTHGMPADALAEHLGLSVEDLAALQARGLVPTAASYSPADAEAIAGALDTALAPLLPMLETMSLEEMVEEMAAQAREGGTAVYKRGGVYVLEASDLEALRLSLLG